MQASCTAYLVIVALSLSFIQQANGQCSIGTIREIEIHGNHKVSESEIRQRISSRVGCPFNMDTADADIKNIFRIRGIAMVTVSTLCVSDGTVMIMTVYEGKPSAM